MRNVGFTLIELLVVVTIIGMLASISVLGYGKIKDRARAGKVAADFQQIKLGWTLWKNASNAPYPNELAGNNPDIACFSEPSIDQTVVQPYLEDIYRGPWEVRYSYDNDGDTYNGSGSREKGVNIILRWCAGDGAQYINIAPFIDETLDGGDGSSAGKVRWFTNPAANGGIIYMLAVNENS